MAADLPLPEHVFVHGFLLMDGEKMSKSLGNVLDPFEVIDRFGTDALRYYLLRDVTFGAGRLGRRPRPFERRYETELANELGNLASRTIAMIARYRDGAVPDGRARPGARRATSTACAERVARAASTAPSSRRRSTTIWQRVRRLNRYVEEQAPWQLAKDRRARGRPRPRAAHAGRGAARRHRAAVAVDPRARPRSCSAPSARPTLASPAPRFGARRVERGRARSSRCSRSTSRPRDRQPHAPRLVRAAERRARRRGRARAGVTRILTVGMDAATNRTRARRPPRTFPQVLRRRRPPPQPRRGLRRRRPRRPRRRSPRTRAARRSARPAWTTSATTRRAPTRSAPSTPRSSWRARPASRSSSTRAPPRTTRSPRCARAPHGLEVILHCFSMPDRLDECLAEGWWISFAGNVTYPKAQRPRRGGRARARRPPARRDRRAVPHAAGRAQGAQPAGLRRAHGALRRRAPRRRPTRSSSALVERNAADAVRRGDRRACPDPAEPAPPARSSACAPSATSARTSSSTRTSSA